MNKARLPGAGAGVITLVALTQFVCSLDFIMVLPLGPDLARGLGISASHIGYITSSYALAAFGFGLGSAGWLDRFDRRTALSVSLLGLVAATALCGVATGMATLLAARFLAGAFAGPVMAVGLAIVSDVVPPERRGRAVTTVVTAGSVASIIGVPAGIVLAQAAGWRAPFLIIAAVGFVILLLTWKALPPIKRHLLLGGADALISKVRTVASPVGLVAVAGAILSSASGYVVIANIAAHLQFNLHVPSSDFARLYLTGGCTAFVVARASGRAIDRFGSWPVMLASNLLFAAVVWELFIHDAAWAPVIALFVGSMTANALRNASLQTILTRVPPPGQRAAFLSVTGSMQQLGSAIGASGASLLLYRGPGQGLRGMDRVGWVAIGLTLTLTPMVLLIDHLRRRDVQAGENGKRNITLNVLERL
jgi:predicted MFS family arabinose efflux permease